MLVRCTVCVSMGKKNSLKISKQTSLIVIQILGSSLKRFFKRGGTGTFSYKWAWFWIRFYSHSKTEYCCVIPIMAETFVSERSWCFINPGIRLHQQCWLWDDSSEAYWWSADVQRSGGALENEVGSMILDRFVHLKVIALTYSCIYSQMSMQSNSGGEIWKRAYHHCPQGRGHVWNLVGIREIFAYHYTYCI